jgi:hypothetical protein
MTNSAPIPDEMIFAALDRAVRHCDGGGQVTVRSIHDHLALSSRSRAARPRAARRLGGVRHG